jgi:VWFA-related protein
MNMSPRALKALQLGLCGLLGATFALAQSAAPPSRLKAAQAEAPPAEALPGGFGEVFDVRVVNVDVVVTDKAGQRVYGLIPSDFKLTVDGQPTNIEYFSEIRGGAAVEASAEVGSLAGVPALTAGQPVGTSYLVFIDELFTVKRDRDRVLDSMVAELPNLGPEDRMAVVAFDGKQLAMLSSWSGSGPDLERVLKRAAGRPTFGLQRLSERRSADIEKNGFNRNFQQSPFEANRLSINERQYAGLLSEQIGKVVNAAAATLRSFAAPPGRKVMIVLSGGWPYSPARFAVNDLQRTVIDDEVPGGEDLFRPMTDTANLLGYTLYTVDVPGLDSTATDASERLAETTDALNTPLSREQIVHESLLFVAEQTGGRAMINAGGRRPLEAVAEDTRSYYWLGFRPQRKGDDQRHDVRITVERPGLRARLRGDYLDFSRSREVSMAVESSLLFGNTSTEGGLTVELGKGTGKRGILEVPLALAFPASAVTFLPAANGYTAQLELRVAAMDEYGNRADIPVVPFTLRSEKPAAPGELVHTKVTLQLRKREHRLVIALYDVGGDAVLATTAAFKP